MCEGGDAAARGWGAGLTAQGAEGAAGGAHPPGPLDHRLRSR